MDPLSALRDFTIRGDLDKIIRLKDEFRFGNEYTFHCSTRTAYRSKQGNLYTLETLVYCIQNTRIKFTDYFQDALALGIPAVTYIDWKPVKEYLSGKLPSTDSIVFPLPQESQNPNLNYRLNDLMLLDSCINDIVEAYKLNNKNERVQNYVFWYMLTRNHRKIESLRDDKNHCDNEVE